MDYLNPPGFLGTGASLLADVTLLAYILLILPGMIAGFVFAKAGKHRPHHRTIMIAITVANWIFILWLMLAALRFDVIDNLPAEPDNARYLFPAIHSLLGLTAQLLATYVVYRMIREDTQVAAAKRRGETNLRPYWFLSAKPFMRVVLLLWFVTSALGIASYLIRYEVVSIPGLSGGTAPFPPVVTPEVTPPAETAEVAAPGSTEEVGVVTTESAGVVIIVTTESPGVLETPEAAGVVETEAVEAPLTTEEALVPVTTDEGIAIAQLPVTTTEPDAPQTTEAADVPVSTAQALVAPLTTEAVEAPLMTEEAAAPVSTEAVEAPMITEEVEQPTTAPTTRPRPTQVAVAVVQTETVETPIETEAVEALVQTEVADAPVQTQDVVPPVETEAVEAPVQTQDVQAPVQTDEVDAPTATNTRRPTVAPTRRPAPTATRRPSATPVEGDPVVESAVHVRLGEILVDPEGRTLYVYANDEPNWSNCTGACLNNWEVYEVDEETPLVLGNGLDGELSLTERADGSFQVTYNGRPLYYFKLDRRTGDALGNGAGNVWSVVPTDEQAQG